MIFFKWLLNLFKSKQSLGERLYQTAIKDVGVKEEPGKRIHPRLLKAFSYVPDWLDRDPVKTAWCGIMMALWLRDVGLEPPNKFYKAISYTDIGVAAELRDIKRGDIVILNINNGGYHVAIFFCMDGPDHILCLGGNQSNKVCIARFSTKDIVAIRRLI